MGIHVAVSIYIKRSYHDTNYGSINYHYRIHRGGGGGSGNNNNNSNGSSNCSKGNKKKNVSKKLSRNKIAPKMKSSFSRKKVVAGNLQLLLDESV